MKKGVLRNFTKFTGVPERLWTAAFIDGFIKVRR